MKTVKPVLFKRKATEKRGTVKIRITDTLSKKSSYVNLGYIIPEKLWNNNTNRVRKSEEVDSDKINNEIVEKLELLGISNNNVKAVRSNAASFVEFSNRYIKRIISHGTRIKYETVMKKLDKYLKHKGKDDLLFAELNSEMVADIRRYFHGNKLSHNTVNSYLKILKSFINVAIKEDEYVYFKHPFATTTFQKVTKTPDSLTEKDIEKIINLNIPTDNYLYKYKLTFLFQFFAQGMRISDVQQLRFNMIKGDYLIYDMRKTGTPMFVKLNDNLIKILKVIVRKYHINDNDPLFAQLFKLENERQLLVKQFKDRIFAVYQISAGYQFYLEGSIPINDEDEVSQDLKREIDRIDFNIDNYYANSFVKFFAVNKEYKTKFIFKYLSDEEFKNIGDDNDFSKMTEYQYKRKRNNNVVIDRNLKKIQKMADVSTTLKTHLARHSYTSQLLNTDGADLYLVSKSLGHSTIKTTEAYISRFQNTKIDKGNQAISDKFKLKI